MKDEDIEAVMKLFSVTREKAMDLIAKGVDPQVIRNGYDLIGSEVSRITKKYTPVFDDLKKKMSDLSESIKSDFQDSVQNVQKGMGSEKK